MLWNLIMVIFTYPEGWDQSNHPALFTHVLVTWLSKYLRMRPNRKRLPVFACHTVVHIPVQVCNLICRAGFIEPTCFHNLYWLRTLHNVKAPEEGPSSCKHTISRGPFTTSTSVNCSFYWSRWRCAPVDNWYAKCIAKIWLMGDSFKRRQCSFSSHYRLFIYKWDHLAYFNLIDKLNVSEKKLNYLWFFNRSD